MNRNTVRSCLLAVVLLATGGSAVRAEPGSLAMKGAAAPSNSGLSIVYSWETGGVVVTAPEGYPLTALRLESAAGLFQPSCENLNGSFDLCWPDRVFKLAADGFSSVDFGAILSPETSGTLLLNDLTVNGATVHGGFHVGDGPWLVHSDFSVAEPSSCVALGMGLCVLIGFSRMRGRA